jgi:protein TonB
VKVSLAGRPDSVEIKTSSGHRLLDQAALETVKSWRFRPARHGGQVVSVVLDVPVVFRLDG